MLRTGLTLALLVALAACGTPDNYMYGGVPAAGSVPAGSLSSVSTSLFGERDTPKGRQRVVILSDAPDLCAKLTANPHFFSAPSTPFVAALFFTPAAKIGNFGVGDAAQASIAVSGGSGAASAVYPAAAGYVYVTEAEPHAGAQAQGTFSSVVLTSPTDPTMLLGQIDGAFVAEFCGAVSALP